MEIAKAITEAGGAIAAALIIGLFFIGIMCK